MNIKWDYKKIGDACIVERGGSPRPIENFITDSSDGIKTGLIGLKLVTRTTRCILQKRHKRYGQKE